MRIVVAAGKDGRAPSSTVLSATPPETCTYTFTRHPESLVCQAKEVRLGSKALVTSVICLVKTAIHALGVEIMSRSSK